MELGAVVTIITDIDKLHSISELVDFKDYKQIRNIIRDLKIAILEHPSSVGFSASQVGYSQRMFVMYLNEKITIFINPSIHAVIDSTAVSVKEGCMSLPGVKVDNINRFAAIKVHYYDEKGLSYYIDLYGYDSIVFQHELDHLNGKLITDYDSIA